MERYEHQPKAFVDSVRDTLFEIGKKAVEKKAQCGCSGGEPQTDQKQQEMSEISAKLGEFCTRFIAEWVRSMDDAHRADFMAALDELADMSTFEAIEMMRCGGHCSPFELLMTLFNKDDGQAQGQDQGQGGTEVDVEIVLDEDGPPHVQEGIPRPIV